MAIQGTLKRFKRQRGRFEELEVGVAGSTFLISNAEPGPAAVDGVTAGTVTASKAVIVDSNLDIVGFNDVGIDNDLSVGGDASITGNVSATGNLLLGGAVTATGGAIVAGAARLGSAASISVGFHGASATQPAHSGQATSWLSVSSNMGSAEIAQTFTLIGAALQAKGIWKGSA